MNVAALTELGRNAALWPRTYVSLAEALAREGVPDDVAREESRMAANTAAMWPEEEEGICPVCGI